MKTPSEKSIVIVLAAIATSSVVVFQACSKGSGQLSDHKNFTLEIGKDQDDFVPYKDKNQFDCALEALGPDNYKIRHKAHDGGPVDDPYQPTCRPNTSLKTDSTTTSKLAKNEPIGDPNVTKKVQSNKETDIKNVLDALQ
jgi:hypothetical protein